MDRNGKQRMVSRQLRRNTEWVRGVGNAIKEVGIENQVDINTMRNKWG